MRKIKKKKDEIEKIDLQVKILVLIQVIIMLVQVNKGGEEGIDQEEAKILVLMTIMPVQVKKEEKERTGQEAEIQHQAITNNFKLLKKLIGIDLVQMMIINHLKK